MNILYSIVILLYNSAWNRSHSFVVIEMSYHSTGPAAAAAVDDAAIYQLQL